MLLRKVNTSEFLGPNFFFCEVRNSGGGATELRQPYTHAFFKLQLLLLVATTILLFLKVRGFATQKFFFAELIFQDGLPLGY